MSIKEKLMNIKEEFRNCEIKNYKGYGFESNEPIQLNSVSYIYDFIQRLRLEDKGEHEHFLEDFVKIETLYDIDPLCPIDHFEIMFKVFRNGSVKSELYDMYFCGYPKGEYSKESLIQLDYSNVKIPAGFKLFLDKKIFLCKRN